MEIGTLILAVAYLLREHEVLIGASLLLLVIVALAKVMFAIRFGASEPPATVVFFVFFLLGIPFQTGAQNTFTDAESDPIKTFLHDRFVEGTGCMVIGFADENGAKTFSAGKLDNGTTNAVNGDTLFFIGSVTKTFTALLLQDMAERGEVRLDDPVAKYLPKSLKMPPRGGKEITLLHLATHSSGLPFGPDNMSGADAREEFESYTVEKIFDFISRFTLKRAPGAEFEYSNLGMSLLGQAMATKAGTNFESLIINRICRPLQMESTCITLRPELKTRLAMGHEKSGKPSPPFRLQAYIPAGGMHSTANDLLKYLSAQLGLTTTKLKSAMEKTHVIRYRDSHDLRGVDDKTLFGNTAMDWKDRGAYQTPGMQLLGHAGGAGSYHAWIGFDTKQKRGVVVLSTENNLSVEAIGWTLLQRLPLTKDNATEVVRERIGLGFALDLTPTQDVRISKVFANSSAALDGLAPGDIIRRIGDVPVRGKSLAECLNLLRADIGGKVELEVVSANETRPTGSS